MQYIVNEYFKYFFHYKEDTDLLESIIDAEDKVTYYTYNAWHEKTSETSPRWEESGAEDFTTYFEYDKASRLSAVLDPLGNATYFDYDSRGDLFAQSNARGIVTEYDYNGLRLRTKQEIKENEVSIQKYEYGYDPYKNRIWEKNSREYTTYFGYDQADRMIKQTDALGNTTYYEIM